MADIQEINDTEQLNDEIKRKNRKRKKSFLQNAKKYGKKGSYGRGSHLTEDTYQYFVNVLEILRKGFETDEEKEIFTNNVFAQTNNEEVNYSCNQIGCRVIETLLPFANDETLERYFKAYDSDLRPLLSDRFASHVIEMLVKIAVVKSVGFNDSDDPDNFKHKAYKFAEKISKFLLNNLEDFVWDTYANHIIRTVLTSLAGILENDKLKKDKTSYNFVNIEKSELPDEYKAIIKDYVERLMLWPQFPDFAYEELTSGLLQSMIVSLRKVDSKTNKALLKKLLEDSFLGDEYKSYLENVQENPEAGNDLEKRMPPVFESEPAIRLLEVAITNAKSKTFTQIYAKCFVNNLTVLAKTKTTNFAVQKLLNHVSEKTEFESMYTELEPELENIILTGYSGVILSLAQTCKRLGTKQGFFIKQIMVALHCNEPAERENYLVPLLLKLVPFERLEATKSLPISLHGSILIQTLLEFNKPIKIVNSILNMDLQDMKKVFCDPKGCHIMDTFMESSFVGEKSREKLIWRLKGLYQEFASTKYGSRSFDAVWQRTNLKQKISIMEELSNKEAGWSNTEFGKIIAAKVNILLFKRNKEQWKNSLNKVVKTKEIFADIINSVN